MNTDNLNTLIQRYEVNFEYINNKENEEIFKWRAVRCFQDVWFDPDAEDISFADRFKAATKECSVLLDNGQVSPTNGIVKMAEQEPEEVERLFVEVLLRMTRETSSCDKIMSKSFWRELRLCVSGASQASGSMAKIDTARLPT